ncbi:MAG: DUF11 domain-containing protein [Oscillospiraceae bacterium]|nr:DUF11 domain-containing protein [Oscillospiraceae bacterium]
MSTKKKAVKPLAVRCLALLVAMLMLLGSFPAAAMPMPVQDDIAQTDMGVESLGAGSFRAGPLGIEPLGVGGNLTWNAPSPSHPVGTTTVNVVVPFTNATPHATFVALGFEWESPLEFVGVTAGPEPSDDVRPAANRAFLQWDPAAANGMGAAGSITLTFNIPAGHPAGDVGDFWMIHVPTTINDDGPVTNIGTLRGTISLYELPPVIDKTSVYTAPLRIGDTVRYTLAVTNPNPVALDNFLVVDNLANGALAADLATVVVSPATALVGTSQLVDGRLELVVNIPADGVTVTFDAQVLQSGTVTNLGSVYGPPVYVPGDNGEPGDYERPDEPIDTDEEPVEVGQLLPPVMAKTSSYTTPLRVGDDVTYTLTLTNPNAVALNNRLIVDNLANGALAADLATVVVTPATALVGTPQLVDGRLELVVNIPANGVTVTFEAEVLQTGTVTNLGSVYGPPVYVPGDNGEPGGYERPDEPEDTDEEPVDVEQLLPPVMAKTSSYTAPLRVGDDVTYTLTLTNPNAVALNNRLIVDNLANGALAADLATVVVTPATALVGTPAIVDGRLELVVNIPATGVTVAFEAEVLQTGTVTNLGSVYGPPVYVPGDNGEPGGYERPDEPEDTDEEPVDVEQLLPPVMAKTSEYTAPLRVGDDVTYTLTLTNPNAVALNNRLIVDNLANGALAADLATVVVTPATALVGTPTIVDGRLELVVNIPATGVTVTFDAEVLQPGTVTNLGSVYGPPVYVPGDNGEPGDYERPDEPEDTDEEPVDVEQLLPPVMAKTSGVEAGDIVRVGDTIVYTLALTNPNTVALNNRLIVDNLANGALAANLATVVVTPATALVDPPQLVDGRLELVVNIPANGVTVTFEAEVLQSGTVTNLGSVYGPPVYVPGDNGEPGDYERPDEPEDTDEEPIEVALYVRFHLDGSGQIDEYYIAVPAVYNAGRVWIDYESPEWLEVLEIGHVYGYDERNEMKGWYTPRTEVGYAGPNRNWAAAFWGWFEAEDLDPRTNGRNADPTSASFIPLDNNGDPTRLRPGLGCTWQQVHPGNADSGGPIYAYGEAKGLDLDELLELGIVLPVGFDKEEDTIDFFGIWIRWGDLDDDKITFSTDAVLLNDYLIELGMNLIGWTADMSTLHHGAADMVLQGYAFSDGAVRLNDFLIDLGMYLIDWPVPNPTRLGTRTP